MPDHRSYRNYFRITVHLLEMMMVNSYLIYREQRKIEK